MSLIAKNQLGTLTENRERNLREAILERYQNVGAQYDNKGKMITEGANWLKGLEGHTKDNIALLFENQAKELLREHTNSSSSGSFENVAFPMVRRIFSKLLANDIVSVQAMTMPSGVLFYYYPEVSDRVQGVDGNGNETQSHTSQHSKNLNACVGANCADTTYTHCKSLYDRFYDDGFYDHSRGKFTIVTASGSPVALDATGCWTTANTMPLATDGSLRHVKYAINGFQGVNSGTSTGHTARLGGIGGKGLEIDTTEFMASFVALNAGAPILDPNGNTIYATGAEIPYRAVAQRYGKKVVEFEDWCNADGTLYLELDLTHPNPECGTCPRYDDYIGAESGTTLAPTDIVFAWRRYEDLEWETEIGEVTFTIKKVTVTATPRKLRARWSPELAQDVNAYHNIDAEAELTALMSEQVAMEIDRQILKELKKFAAWNLRWDFLGWKKTGSQKYTEKEWKQTLITKINQLSAQIHKRTLRGGANFIVVSSEVSALFDDLENFMVSNGNIDDDKYNLGMRRIGTLSGRYTVYVDPYSRPGDVLIGHKGTSILDTGYVYAPYIPVQLTPVLTDVNTMTSVKGLMTRYATEMVNNSFYATIRVDNIPTFDTREFR